MDCLRRKHHKKREHKKHHHLSPHVSPAHSQPSTLKTTVNSTLPKAGSTGLWMDTPGMYGMAPHHNYYYGRPHGYNMHGVDHGYNIPRAVSETRIPQPGMPYGPYRHQFGSQSNVFLLPVPGQRFYHSQPLAPVFELPPSRGMEIYDYPYTGANGGFRSKLLETRHTPDYYNSTSEFILKPRIERSKSDAEKRRPAKPQGQKERPKENTTSSAENGKRLASKENKNYQAFLEDDEKELLKSSGAQRATHENVHHSHVNNAISVNSVPTGVISTPSKVQNSKAVSTERIPLEKDTGTVGSATASSSENISSSATDSMKLLAKNKTDDQKTKPTFTPVVDNNSNRMDEANREFNIKHYKYEGSIYAVPEKNIRNIDYDNPIISRMKEMVIERSRSSNVLPHRNDFDDDQERIMSNNGIQNAAPESALFKDVTKITKVTKTKVIESLTPGYAYSDTIHSEQQANTFNDIVDGLVLPDILVPDEESYKSPSSHTSVQQKSAGRSMAAAETTTDLNKSSRHVAEQITDALSPKGSADTDGGNDDLNRAGKQLATSAFQFLDNYLSDDEGTDSLVESPPLSPGGLRAGQVY